MSDNTLCNFVRDQAIKIGLPLAVDCIKDMITGKTVNEYREKLIALGFELTGKTETELDDKAWAAIAKTALNPEFFSEKGTALLDIIIGWVKKTENVWSKAAAEVLTQLQAALHLLQSQDVATLAQAHKESGKK